MKGKEEKASESNCKTVNIMINHKTATSLRRREEGHSKKGTIKIVSGFSTEKDDWSTT